MIDLAASVVQGSLPGMPEVSDAATFLRLVPLHSLLGRCWQWDEMRDSLHVHEALWRTTAARVMSRLVTRHAS